MVVFKIPCRSLAALNSEFSRKSPRANAKPISFEFSGISTFMIRSNSRSFSWYLALVTSNPLETISGAVASSPRNLKSGNLDRISCLTSIFLAGSSPCILWIMKLTRWAESSEQVLMKSKSNRSSNSMVKRIFTILRFSLTCFLASIAFNEKSSNWSSELIKVSKGTLYCFSQVLRS